MAEAPPAAAGRWLQSHDLGSDPVARRDLFALELSGFDALPEKLSLPSPHFACLVAGDAEETPRAEGLRFFETLVRAGAVYVCTWGPGCRRLAELCEHVTLGLAPLPGADDGVVTRCHESDSLDEVLWTLIHLTDPAEAYSDSCGTALAITVGETRWSRRIRSVLAEPHRLEERVASTAGGAPPLIPTRSPSRAPGPSWPRG